MLLNRSSQLGVEEARLECSRTTHVRTDLLDEHVCKVNEHIRRSGHSCLRTLMLRRPPSIDSSTLLDLTSRCHTDCVQCTALSLLQGLAWGGCDCTDGSGADQVPCFEVDALDASSPENLRLDQEELSAHGQSQHHGIRQSLVFDLR